MPDKDPLRRNEFQPATSGVNAFGLLRQGTDSARPRRARRRRGIPKGFQKGISPIDVV